MRQPPLASALHVDRALCALQGTRNSVLILNLHRVSPVRNDFWPPLDPDMFEGLLRFLESRCRFTTFARLNEDSCLVVSRDAKVDAGHTPCPEGAQYRNSTQ
jgi:hypothetical protein